MLLFETKIYNFDGQSYIYMGKGKLGTRQGVCTISIPEKYGREAVTNRYLCVPDIFFHLCHRNETVVVHLGEKRKKAIMDRKIEVVMI